MAFSRQKYEQTILKFVNRAYDHWSLHDCMIIGQYNNKLLIIALTPFTTKTVEVHVFKVHSVCQRFSSNIGLRLTLTIS